MKLPEIYRKPNESQGESMPALELIKLENYYKLIVVDPRDGRRIISLQLINDKGIEMTSRAKQAIEHAGFSTAWAEWTNDGMFVRLISVRICPKCGQPHPEPIVTAGPK